MIYHVTIGERTLCVELDGGDVTVDGERYDVRLGASNGGPVRSLVVGPHAGRVTAARRDSGRWEIHLGGRRLQADVVDERTRTIRAMTGGGAASLGPRPIVAPMPGMVVRVEVSQGDVVAAGQGVVIVEAMKMENELVAESPGVVGRIHVAEGEAVEKDQLLVDLGPLEGEEQA